MYDPGSDQIRSYAISLHRNENLFIEKDFLKKLHNEALKSIDLNIYPESSSYKLRSEIAKKHGCTPEEIYVGNGADGVLGDLLQHLRNQYNEMGLQPCTYQVYPYLCSRYAFQRKTYLETNQLWVIDSPNSINGKTFDFSNNHLKPDFIVWDNTYGDFDEDNPLPKFNSESILRVNSFSKFYGLAALRVGYCIAHKTLVSILLSKKDIFNVNSVAQQIALHALKNHRYFESLIPKIKEVKGFLIKALTDLGFQIEVGRAHFLWMYHPEIKAKLIEQKLKNKGILVRHFNLPNLDHGLRVTIPPFCLAEKLINTLKSVLKSSNNKAN